MHMCSLSLFLGITLYETLLNFHLNSKTQSVYLQEKPLSQVHLRVCCQAYFCYPHHQREYSTEKRAGLAVQQLDLHSE